ncbi:MAG: WecB/TagA/CpsF family glycosyltransferase [Longimicrobiales bacterium]
MPPGESRPPDSLPDRVRILGTPVSRTDLDGAVDLAVHAVDTGRVLRIGVVNHNKCWLARRDPSLRAFLEEAELVVAESSVEWAARLLGFDGVGAAWGVALMARLLERADAGGWSVYFLGAEASVTDRLVHRVRANHPGLVVAGWHHGYLSDQDAARVREELASVRPDLLLVAMGSPRQERFLASVGRDGGPRVSLGVGGSFDVHAGRKADAPGWIRGSGFEWLYRALLSPRLFRRYAVVIPWFVGAVVRERLTRRAS